ncbi:hypothetical protein J8281_05030 [Aquimarina sp. U1-2]|uniref:hypothetical protein n=1 Tax=Aquimarina sp. U1-2 TaxID=2823141 RepID=UPI001AECFAF4|nr:hypothetical protein [Aquimarina sp. U1-2]MBP2831545.1 hypothetical protein [Aquimarina sp. U1-2]
MNEKLFCIIALFCWGLSIGQSTNLANKPFKTSYIKLPSQPVLDDSRRTYTTNSKYIFLRGFSKVNSGATLDITLDYQGISAGEYEIQRELIEKKDDNGTITSSYYLYRILVDYNSNATIQISNSLTAEAVEKSFSENNTLRSNTFSTAEEAKKYYYNNNSTIKKRYRSEQWVRIIRRIRNYLNSTYGYIPSESNNETFLIVSSKKHPEYSTHQKAYEELKNIFDRMYYKAPISALFLRAQPIIASFDKIAQNYTSTKRKERKLRHASYSNISKIYYFFDNPGKAREYALKMITNDFNASEGRAWLKKADLLQEKFEINQTSSRHFDIFTEDLTNLTETPFDDETTVEEIEKPEDHIIAYLITAANDTIAAQITKPAITEIGYQVALQVQDENGAVRTTPFDAENSKTLALGNGDIYTTVTFKEATNGKTTPKFVKIIHKSDQISLFLYDNKELILKTPESEIGTSTLSSEFIFDLRKKLVKYAGECVNLAERASKNEFKNTQDSLLQFCKALSACQE